MDSNELLGRQALLEKVGAANAVYPMRCDEGLDATSSASARSASSTSSPGHGRGTATRPALPAHGPWTPTPANSSASTRTPAGDNKHPRMTLTYRGIARARLVISPVAGSPNGRR